MHRAGGELAFIEMNAPFFWIAELEQYFMSRDVQRTGGRRTNGSHRRPIKRQVQIFPAAFHRQQNGRIISVDVTEPHYGSIT